MCITPACCRLLGKEAFLLSPFLEQRASMTCSPLLFQNDSVVAGGGAIEMELSKYLRDYSRTIPGKQQLLIGAYAKALEIIPRQLCDNAGFDATNILNKLRAKHAQVGAQLGAGRESLQSWCPLVGLVVGSCPPSLNAVVCFQIQCRLETGFYKRK